ncbi:MAG: 30S ribosomal protein S1 [Sulfuricurvum sp.]|jgi:small subunit ribosomal protein S1
MAVVDESHEEESFAKLFAESERQQSSTNRVVEGEIVEIQAQENRAMVGVGDKNEGILSLDEIRGSDGELLFGVGDKISVLVTGYYNERPKISYEKAEEQRKTLEFIKAHKDDFEDITVEGVITKKNRGGYVVEADGLSYFLPRSLAAFKESDNVIGKSIKAQIVKIDDENSTIVLSRRKLFSEDRKKKKEIVDALLEKDEIVRGIVKKITSYGMFVDVGGVDGLVHYNEISYKGPVNPAKLYKDGDEVEVKAIAYDKEKRHLSLSIKATHPDPWAEIESELEEGDTITVTVSNIEAYGAFVDLGNDIEGFLHISEMSWDKNFKNPSDYLTLGEEIDVEVIEIDPKVHKLRVSLKKLMPKPFDEFLKNYKEGDVVKGSVTSLTDFGAFVRIGSIEGLLHNQDLSWDKKDRCKDMLKVGDEVEVKIVKINAQDEKISLSKKALLSSPIDTFASENRIGTVVKGNIKDIKDFGVFVALDSGVDALIRDEDLAPLNKEELSVGDSVEACVSAIDTKRDRIRLSVRRLEQAKSQAMLEQINDTVGNSLGDLIKDKIKY